MDFHAYPKTGRLKDAALEATHDAKAGTLPFRGTVKAHGTHIDIVRQNGQVHFQSRNRILSPESDNYGFVRWVRERPVQTLLSLLPAGQDCVIACEYCGGDIQKGVALTGLPTFLVLFAVRVGRHWADMHEHMDMHFPEQGFYNARRFKTFDTDVDLCRPAAEHVRLQAIVDEVERLCPIGEHFGVQGVGEGIVWVPADDRMPMTRYMFKVKGQLHADMDTNRIEALRAKLQSRDLGLAVRLHEVCHSLVNEHRLMKAKQYATEMGEYSIPVFMKWIVADVESEENDILRECNIPHNKLTREVAKIAIPWFKQHQS